MRALFDQVSQGCSKSITKTYSTSFSLAVRMLSTEIRQDIHNIYGFVRLADEIVDSFHDHDKRGLLENLQRDLDQALVDGVSINPVLNSFQMTVRKHKIDNHLITSFMDSMRMDLDKSNYDNEQDYHQYIYGSADVVGLMCLKVFVKGDEQEFEKLSGPAKRLGSAFQKVNFLRDIKDDIEGLDRSYFPNVDMQALNAADMKLIIDEIEEDFKVAYTGVVNLPVESRFGVYTAYRYYKRLLEKLKKTAPEKIMVARIRVSNGVKLSLLAKSYLRTQFNILR